MSCMPLTVPIEGFCLFCQLLRSFPSSSQLLHHLGPAAASPPSPSFCWREKGADKARDHDRCREGRGLLHPASQTPSFSLVSRHARRTCEPNTFLFSPPLQSFSRQPGKMKRFAHSFAPPRCVGGTHEPHHRPVLVRGAELQARCPPPERH